MNPVETFFYPITLTCRLVIENCPYPIHSSFGVRFLSFWDKNNFVKLNLQRLFSFHAPFLVAI